MERKTFLRILTMSALGLQHLDALANAIPSDNKEMPVVFAGHGSPMNGIEDNTFSRTWVELAKTMPIPEAVVVVSAHWLTRGTWVTAMEHPRTIHDFAGFPPQLSAFQYPAPGSPTLAREIVKGASALPIQLDHEWGLDHGTWSVIRWMYPKANIPVLQVSLDMKNTEQQHYELGQALAKLRKRRVLVIGSGNMVHNLRMIAWDKLAEPDFGFDWAQDMNVLFKEKISKQDHTALINYRALSKVAMLAIPTPDHYWPLLTTLGLTSAKDSIRFFNDNAVGGSLTMTGVVFGG